MNLSYTHFKGPGSGPEEGLGQEESIDIEKGSGPEKDSGPVEESGTESNIDSNKKVPLVIFHGLFGGKKNWKTVARDFSVERDVWTVDFRAHGDSPDGDITSEVFKEDIQNFLVEKGLKDAVVMGHSLGGRAASRAVEESPELVSALIVVDVSPFEIPEEVCTGLRGIAKTILTVDPSEADSRSDMEEWIIQKIGSREIARFLLQNIEKRKMEGSTHTDYAARTAESFQWTKGTVHLAENIELLCSSSYRPQDYSIHRGLPVLLVRGSSSLHFPETDREGFFRVFPEAQEKILNGADHWLHITRRREFEKVVQEFLSRL